jgi:hypothetical protein
MTRRARKVAAAVAIGVWFATRSVWAMDSGIEASAKIALKRAAERYVAADLASAMELLAKAAHACGATRCRKTTKAALLRDLGAVQLRSGEETAAMKSFKRALDLQPDLALRAPYDTPDVTDAWNEAGGTGDSSKSAPAPNEEPEQPPAREPAPETPPPSPSEEPRQETATEPALEQERAIAAGAYARWWVGIEGALDFLSLPEGDDLCTLGSRAMPENASGYYCTNPNGSDFPTRSTPGQNASLIAGQAGHVSGGVHPGDARVLVAVDYALTSELLVGARLGYALNTYPSAGAAVTDHRAFGSKIHLEMRGTYVFGDAPLTHTGFAPTLLAAIGVAEFDGHATSIVSMNANPEVVPVSQPVNIWRTNGPWFVAAGGGVRYQLSPRAAFNAALRVNVAFGGVGALLSYGPDIAFQYGF